MTTAADIFAAEGELGFLAELSRAAYHLRVDANPHDGIDSNEWPSLLFSVDPAVDPSFALADSYLQLLNPADFGTAGAQLQLNAGWFYTDGLENGIFTTSNAAALVGRSADALFIAFRGTNDSTDVAEDALGGFDTHWADFAALRAAITAYIDNPANGIAHVYVTGHSLGAAMVQAMMIEHAGDARFEAATFGSPGFDLGSDQPDSRITNIANDGDIISWVEALYRIDGDSNVFTDGITGLTVGITEHSMNLYYDESQFLLQNGIDITQLHSIGGRDYDSVVFAAHDNGDNTFTIGLGDDTLSGTPGAEILLGGAGNDVIYGGAGHDDLVGGDGNDTLVGNADIFAQESDTLLGGNGNDTILGEYTDVIDGGSGTNYLYAVNSYDWSIDLGATNIEWMSAGFGNDTIDASTETAGVTIYASGGNDVLIGSNQADFLWAGVGNDTVNGGGGDDVIVGDQGADSLSGGDGNDSVYTDGVDALLDGGNGTDALYVVGGAGFNIDLAATHFEWFGDYAGGNDTVDDSGNTADTVVYAGAGNDLVKGGSGNDFLWGEAGADTITGGGGNDTLVGGTGGDSLTGGIGNDTIFCNSGGGGDGAADTVFFDAAGWGTDYVYDFEHGLDKLDLHGSGATAGTVSIGAFVFGSGSYAFVNFGADRIVVVGLGNTLDMGDLVF